MKKELKTKVCIIGAGPGGATTALFLAKAGIKCLLVDKAVFPRDKICGDALSGKVVQTLKKLDEKLVDELSEQDYSLGSWGVTFVAPNLKALRVPFKKDFVATERAPGFLAKRMDFDNFLVEQVRKQPLITFLEDVDIIDYQRVMEEWHIKDKRNEYHINASLIILADGAHSAFARHQAGINIEQEHYCAGLRAYYKNVSGLDDNNFIELHFLKEFLPGYFWIFPLANGYANVGVGMRSDKVSAKKINLKKEMLRLIDELPAFKERFKEAELIGNIHGYGLPLGSKKRPISGDGYMLLGDAASLIDPFTGEGISNAMISGMKAAVQVEACLKENNFSAAFIKKYDEAVYKRLWSELRLSKKMQELVNYPWLFNMVVNKTNRSKPLQELIMSMFEDVDLRQRLKNPLFYFKLLFS